MVSINYCKTDQYQYIGHVCQTIEVPISEVPTTGGISFCLHLSLLNGHFDKMYHTSAADALVESYFFLLVQVAEETVWGLKGEG